jgi:hypothetical protein
MRYGALLISLLAGCASTDHISRAPAVKRTAIADITDDSLAHDYGAERSYRKNPDEPLRLGLALSGGGTKAAMFSHGVLKGLQDAGILQKVDAISSVSGGGYAAYWYFSKLLAADEQGFPIGSIFADCMPSYWTKYGDNEKNLVVAMKRAVDPTLRENPDPLASAMPECKNADHYAGPNDPYRWQAHLVRWPDVFGTEPVSHDGSPQGRPEREIRAGLFDGLVIEPITQMFKHQSSIPNLYQWGIERTWGLNPEPRKGADKWSYSNAAMSTDNGPLRVNSAKVTWHALRALYDRSHSDPNGKPLPLWIVNANSGGKTLDAADNATRIFEMTAFGSGAEEFGYVNNIDSPPIEDLGTSVRAAAGFADAQGLTGISRAVVEFLSEIWPGARWGVPVEVATQTGAIAKPRLSDGGGGENLGLYSLLKRGVKDIIVVDTAQDVTGDMEDICTVKRALGNSVKMDFPTLNKLDKVCSGELAYNVSDWKSPVVKGTVTWYKDEKPVRESRIWLIKAAWNQRQVRKTYNNMKCGNVGEVDCLLTVFYGHNSSVQIHGKNDPQGFMVFPQLATVGTTANSSSYLFWGYRELGRSIARQLAWDATKGELSTTSLQCTQLAAPKRGGSRPYDWDDPKVAVDCPSAR